MSSPALLARNEVHLWYLSDGDHITESVLERWRSLATAEERLQNSRYTFEAGRREHAISHGFVRDVLSGYLNRESSLITFKKNQYGRPELVDQSEPPVHFNISHSSGFYVCAVARSYEVGVDTEKLIRKTEYLDVAESVFSQQENAKLKSLESASRREFFFQIWTLKESYIKARGMGLSLPLEKFSFDPHATPIQIAFDPDFSDTADLWEFRLFLPQPECQVALAFRRRASDIVQVQERFFKLS